MIIAQSIGNIFNCDMQALKPFFYVSLFPIFVDKATLTFPNMLIITLVTIITVGGVKIAYEFSARKLLKMTRNLKLENGIKKTTGGFMIGVGSYLIVKI